MIRVYVLLYLALRKKKIFQVYEIALHKSKKNDNFASKIKLYKYEQDNIGKSSDRVAT